MDYRLRKNGALNPDKWRPSNDNLDGKRSHGRARPGELVGWRYAVWRVHEVNPVPEVDMTERDWDRLRKDIGDYVEGGARVERQAKAWPCHLILRHVAGPLIAKPGEGTFTRLHDGTREVHLGWRPLVHELPILTDPYRVCSCHGHVWPCQEIDLTELAAIDADNFARLEAMHAPGVCAECRELITTRQKTVTFPETSRWLPGAPGPTFHAGKARCWGAAEQYERSGRLQDNPGVTRLASCPGIRFIHEAHACPTDKRVECTAGPMCTGLHGPAGYRNDVPCWQKVQWMSNEGAYPRPSMDCGYHRPGLGSCLGGDMSSGGGLSDQAADLYWEHHHHWEQRVEADADDDSDG